MSISKQMLHVLGQPEALTPKDYNFLLESLSQYPGFLSNLAHIEDRDWLFDLFTSHSDRLAMLFTRIHSSSSKIIDSGLRFGLAQQTVQLLLEALPMIYNVLEDTTIVELLTPGLALCVEQRPTSLQTLAKPISTRTSILQNLFAYESSGMVMKAWTANASFLMPKDPETLEAWTRILSLMVENCLPDRHGASRQLHRFKTLINLRDSLLEHERRLDMRITSIPLSSSNLDGLKVLEKDDKKGHRAKQVDDENRPLEISEDLKASLVSLDLEIPHSRRTLQHVIYQLKVDRTRELLVSIADTFPCSRCKSVLKSGSVPEEIFAQIPTNIDAPSDLSLHVFGNQVGTWNVVLSQAALKSLQCMEKLETVQSKLVDLSNMCAKHRRTGTEEQQNRLQVILFETKCGKDLFILWQIDVEDNAVTGMLRQEVKIWEIGSRKQIAKAIDHVIVLQQNYSEDTIRQCRQRPESRDNPLPLQFQKTDWQMTCASEKSRTLDVRLLEQETINLANKFYTLTEPVLRSVLANDVSAQFPFDLSAEEATIIKHFQTSSLILGRSGTGKTTCLVFKVVAKFLASKVTEGKPIRQVLLTRSSHLAQKLQSYTFQLIKTLDMQSKQTATPTTMQAIGQQEKEGSVVVETAFTLQDDSFPVICTFDYFLQILENTVKAMDRHNFKGFGGLTKPDSSGLSPGIWKVVDYTSFRLDYWPHFPLTLTKRVPTALVFSEIMGVIKGSSSSSETLKHMSRNEYLTRSLRQAPVFSEKERPIVFDIFEHYEDLKLRRNEMDYVDRVLKILAAVRASASLKKLLGFKFHELYIDEVQDQRTMDIELFLTFINDSRGLHFAGDTAQAIANDASFRFEDVSALLYKRFSAAGDALNQKKLAKPTMFKLLKNYRSHKGILRLASLVMDLLWRGYPETVDRLGPEIGQLFGPMPTIFLGCDIDLLTSTNVGHVKLTENTADFGAEQVIVVRDDQTKIELQTQIGDVALVLTILQSKGMEFDDVILWDFFSRCPNETGVRNLHSLMQPEAARRYARQHADMCAELKRLYVAITRARIQLFFIESSEKAMRSVIDLFQGDSKELIVDVTSPGDRLFEEKLRSLRPGQSVDPRRWSLRGEQFLEALNFKDALFCFRKAQNSRGKKRAQAEIHAEDARICRASGDIDGSLLAFSAAKELFMELNMIAKAAAILEAMDRIADAAQLWIQQGSFGKAAALFSQANLWLEAANCHECDGKYEAAATALRSGNELDALVMFLSRNQSRLDPSFYQRFTRLCKVLLKQGKISTGCRKQAISLLGSVLEQEQCFREYDMHLELEELYESQHRFADVFSLQVRLGQLKAALQTAVKHKLALNGCGIAESQVVHLMDYVLTGRMLDSLRQSEKHHFQELEVDRESLTPRMAARLGQWEIVNRLLPWNPSSEVYQAFEKLESIDMRGIFSLLSITYYDVTVNCADLADLPFRILLEAVQLMSDVVFKSEAKATSALKLVCGLGSIPLFGEHELVLPWSPFATVEVEDKVNTRRLELFALGKLASAVELFDSKALTLWKIQTEDRCHAFLVKGACDRKGCRRLHKPMMSSEYIQNTTELQSIVHVVCSMTKLYYRRIMPEEFQNKFLKMKRRWLEILIRQLTYGSAFEQDFRAITTERLKIANGNSPPASMASMEDLLFVRIRTEWEKRKLYSKLLEEIQVAELLGSHFKSRFHRALSYQLSSSSEMRQISLPRLLKEAVKSGNCHIFKDLLSEFIDVLRKTKTFHMISLYSLVTELESLAAFLIMKICSPVSLLPESWLMPNIAWIIDSNPPTQPLGLHEKTTYTRCLFSLAEYFCELLRRLEMEPLAYDDGPNFPPYLLRQRNAELLAVVALNLAADKGLKFHTSVTWIIIRETFQRVDSNAADYKYNVRLPGDLLGRLHKSFTRYEGKNTMVLFVKSAHAGHPFTAFKDARILRYDELRPLLAAQAPPATSSNSPDQYSGEEVASTTKIQRFWRKFSPEFKKHQTYLKSPIGQAIAKYIALGSDSSTTFQMRAALVSEGPDLQLRLNSARDLIAPLRPQVMAEIESIEDSDDRYAVLDDALHNCRTTEDDLKEATTLISEKHLQALVVKGVVPDMKRTLSEVANKLKGVEKRIGLVRKALNT